MIFYIRNTVSNTVVNIAYGHNVRVNDVDYINYAEHTHKILALTAKPFAYIADLVPFCTLLASIFLNVETHGSSSHARSLASTVKYSPSWLPGCTFKKEAALWMKELEDMAHSPFATVRTEVVRGFSP